MVMVIEPLHDYVPAFKAKVDRIFYKGCSPTAKLNQYMDLILELKTKTEKTSSLSSNDMKVIFALMNRAMRAL